MSRTAQEDHKLMSLLKVTEISRVICDTNMGTLKLRIRKGESTYRFLLDAVELPKALNKEVYELLYAPRVVTLGNSITNTYTAPKLVNEMIKARANPPIVSKPKGGRPKGAKNKIK